MINSDTIQHRGKGTIAGVGSGFDGGAYRVYGISLNLDANACTITVGDDEVVIEATDIPQLMAQHPVGQQLLRAMATGEMPQNYQMEAEGDLS